ncbi:methyltransferase domain-containing protein [Thiotrichales bacterium 19S3-7]|nr:methyltransferase domain-containing protein [Thiotrichales bacterium 19S3-7]MCF6802228.1 methyltransferase domain-containing protein [Thiotrichales bacterium 19S3-11]
MSDFDKTTSFVNYNNNAINQTKASDILISLLKVKGTEKIIDIGCGTGTETIKLSKITSQTVLGIDASEGMIAQCNTIPNRPYNVSFKLMRLESSQFHNDFDIAFCNSVFHWFKSPKFSLKLINNLLKENGIFALQCPLKKWSPLLIEAINNTLNTKAISKYSQYYLNPWFHLESVDDYCTLLLDNEFSEIAFAQNSKVTTKKCDNQSILNMFMSGPASAYLNPDNYNILLPNEFKDQFINTLNQQILKLTNNKLVDVTYNRCFILAKK